MYPPEDLMLQILVRLPPKSLSRFRSVCKALQAIIDSPSFRKQYLLLTYGASSHDHLNLICQQRVSGPNVVTFLLSDGQIIDLKCLPGITDLYKDTDRWFFPSISGPINGIYCIEITPTQSSRITIMFWNPGNGQFRVLPPIPHPVMPNDLEDYYNGIRRDPLHAFYGGFEFDPLFEDYKSNSISEYALASKSWQQLDPFQLACPGLIIVYDDGRPRSFAQLLFLARTALGKAYVRLTTVDGCLAAVSSEDSFASNHKVATIISVGVMKEYGIEESWIKAYRIALNAPGTFLGVVEDELFVKETDGWVVSYCLGAHQEDYNEYCYAPFQESEILPFEGSFIPVNRTYRDIGCHGYGETRMPALHWHKLYSAIIILCDERRACGLSKVNLVAMNLKTDYLHASKKAK
ncbi:hypothetical protein Cgig2_009432 [Carnegiea gigantea]|uniref:F-box domain-containing protein n=1 Tax=Carnegiea gigantea TaxID=171969 RepID=A0A9Q1JSL7_9CARY|nr:hypothetical protein Cgig2_009432 [Carnegiea gigantea]